MKRLLALILSLAFGAAHGATAIPNIFATQPSGNVPASYLDVDFALIANYNTFSNYLVDTGAANAYVVTLPASTTASLVAGLAIQFKAASDNTTASTLNVNGVGVKNITNYDASALTAGQIKNGGIVSVIYDGTQFKLASQPGVVPAATLAPQATNTVLGNATAGSAAPTALAIGTCSTASSALIWTTNTGFGCNTSITANISGNSTITDDTTTAATMYPVWVTANTGNLPVKVSSTKLTFNPSTGTLTATSGAFTNIGGFALTGGITSATNQAINIGTGTLTAGAITSSGGSGNSITLTDTAVANATWNFYAQTGNAAPLFRLSYNNGALDVLTASATGAVTIPGTLGVTSDFSVATSKFTVAAATGNTLVAGTLGVSGQTGIGVAANTGMGLYVASSALTGTTQIGGYFDPVTTSGATTIGYGLQTRISTAAAAYTQLVAAGLHIQSAVAGAGSAITTLYGLKIESQAAGGTNYAIHTSAGTVLLGSLAGVGTRAVVVDANGVLSAP